MTSADDRQSLELACCKPDLNQGAATHSCRRERSHSCRHCTSHHIGVCCHADADLLNDEDADNFHNTLQHSTCSKEWKPNQEPITSLVAKTNNFCTMNAQATHHKSCVAEEEYLL
eukprot:GHRQ01009638.1.p2 GENE.GHRQ01009638.1~~GHRQ01009638.1.p2  ORF type:complete len:115 (+),score=9.92 GHRQ01009638.1:382-726(+)